jgi:hypothetical protein
MHFFSTKVVCILFSYTLTIFHTHVVQLSMIQCITDKLVISCQWVLSEVSVALEHLFCHSLIVQVIIYNWTIVNSKNVSLHSRMCILAESNCQIDLETEHML